MGNNSSQKQKTHQTQSCEGQFETTWKNKLKQVRQVNLDYSNHFDKPPQFKGKPKVILDTDIASDIDDALALLLMLHLPLDEFDLLGIVTVYGYVEIRKSVTEAILRPMNNDKLKNIPIIAGISSPMSGEQLWHTEVEGEYVLDQDKIPKMIEKSSDEYLHEREPIKWYADTLGNLQQDENVVIIIIGAFTNIAQLYMQYPSLAKQKIERLVIMSGGLCKYPHREFHLENRQEKPLHHSEMKIGQAYSHTSCHNVRCDINAAHFVISKATEWEQTLLFITTEVTHELWLDGDKMQKLLDAKEPHETAVVAAMTKSWLDYRTKVYGEPITGTCPHDAVAVMEGIFPGMTCKYKRGWFFLEEQLGYTIFIPDPTEGQHYGSAVINGQSFLELLTNGLLNQLTLDDIMQYNIA